jgi:subtilisin family serine protease
VALDHTLAQDYRAREAVSIRDHLIINRSLQELTGINPHDATGYLAHLEVRKVVHHAMRFDTAGRFVVARDVAERFAAPARHPVLIEVLEPRYGAVGETPHELEEREANQPEALRTLEGRVTRLAGDVRALIRKHNKKEAVEAARVQELRKYVAAHLTPSEIQDLGNRPKELHVYAVWRSAKKRKLLNRSHGPLSADAARQSYSADGRGIRWAVLDTGCRSDHPHFNSTEFGTTVEDVLDCTTNSRRPVSIANKKRGDRDGHGTHVSGIIAGGGTFAGNSYFGIAPRAKLIVYKVLDDNGVGEDAWIIKAIDDIWRRNQNEPCTKIHGVNLSLGGQFDATVYGCGFSPICKDLRDLWRQGVIVCVAAGNEGQIEVSTADGSFDLNTQLSIGDPANLEECIAVGSVNTDKPHFYGVSYFSSRGPTADGRRKPDVVAPGERITSCNSNFKPGGKGDKAPYRPDSGTSMACPHVSGFLAAFLSVRREYIGRPDEVKEVLLRTCADIGRDRYHQGHGIPNLMRMLLEV